MMGKRRRPTVRRRRHVTELWLPFLAAVGAGLERVSHADTLTLLPANLRPYVLGAAVALGAVAIVQRLERRRDEARAIQRETGEHESGE